MTLHAPMIDPFGRHVTYLRVSVTDRCDFRCVYCMAEDMTFLPKKDLLSLEELDRVCSAFIEKGVKKLRLTGGEPLVRKGIMTLVESLGRHLALGRAGGTDAHHQRQPARETCRRTRGPWREAHQRLGRYAGRREVQGHHPLGRPRQGEGGHPRRAGGRAPDQDQCRGAQGRQRRRDPRDDPLGAWGGHGPDPDRDHAAGRHRWRPHRPVSAALGRPRRG